MLLKQLRAHSNSNKKTNSPSLSRSNTPSFLSSSDPITAICETLHLAAMSGHTECLEEALRNVEASEKEVGTKGGINTKDRMGMTAAHHAALNGLLAPLSLLHERGADIQAKVVLQIILIFHKYASKRQYWWNHFACSMYWWGH